MNRKHTEKITQRQTQAICKEKEDGLPRAMESHLWKGDLSPNPGLEMGAQLDFTVAFDQYLLWASLSLSF